LNFLILPLETLPVSNKYWKIVSGIIQDCLDLSICCLFFLGVQPIRFLLPRMCLCSAPIRPFVTM
jgi:hypothetical protein